MTRKCLKSIEIGRSVSPINLNCYHYAGNNPVRYTDPDGNDIVPFGSPREFFGFLKSIASGQDKVYAGCMEKAYSARPQTRLVDMQSLISKLEKIPYQGNDTERTVYITSRGAISVPESITLERNFIENFACALPLMSNATMADIDQEQICMGPAAPAKSSAASFAFGIAGNMLRGISDVKLNYVKTAGRITSWSISKTGLDYKNAPLENKMSKADAMNLLKQNMENPTYYDNKNLKKFNDSL